MDPKNALTMNVFATPVVGLGGTIRMKRCRLPEAREQMPDSNEVRDTIGWIYFKKDLSESAARAFADLVEKHPENWMFPYRRDGAGEQ